VKAKYFRCGFVGQSETVRHSQKETAMNLDDAYANAAFIPDGNTYPARWQVAANSFRASNTGLIDIPYGAGARERFDLFRPSGPLRGTVVFVHGGYWKAFDKSLWSHLAAGPLAQGWAVALPSYDLCPGVRIAEITAQIARAVTAIAERVVGPLVLTGHSAGGHLVARMGCADVALPEIHRVTWIVPISPLADLAPLMQTSMNGDLRIDVAEAQAESPVHHPAPPVPVTVWVGAAERPAFVEQAQLMARVWDCRLVIAPKRHHFDVIAEMETPDSPLTRLLCGAA
jgi:arylformamidase